MKCPNCSFMNPDRSVMCKICGYEFNTSPSQRGSHDSELAVPREDDSEIEVTFDTLFGVRSNPRKIKNPLDKSKDKKRELDASAHEFESPENLDAVNQTPQVPDSQSLEDVADVETHASSVLRPHIPVQEYETDEFETSEFKKAQDVSEPSSSDIALDENGDVIDIELVQTGEIQNDFYTSTDDILDDDDQKKNNRKITVILLVVVILLIALVLAITSSKLNLNPFTSEPNVPASEPVDNTPIDSNSPQTDAVINSDPNDTVNSFFAELPGYVNDNNISFSMFFKTPQSALEILTTFKNKGHIDQIEFDISDTILNGNNTALINVVSNIERTHENKHLISQDEWQFSLIKEDETWLIQDLSLNNQESIASDSATDANANTSNTSTPPTQSSSSTTTSTPPIKPEGFVKSGGFKGGIVTDGQDISGIRYGNHDQFERLVIDLSEWQKTNADGSAVNVKEACHYETSISADGLEVSIVLSGVRSASAVAPVIAPTSNIKSVDVYYPADDSVIGLSIKLKKPSSYKVFPLKEPGRIVIDTMPES